MEEAEELREECPKCGDETAHGSDDSWQCDNGCDLKGWGKCPGVSGSDCSGWFQNDRGYCENCMQEL